MEPKKILTAITLSAVLVFSVGWNAAAQQHSNQQQQQSQQQNQQGSQQQTGDIQQPYQKLVGKTVEDPQGEKLGTIDQIITGEQDNSTYVILSAEGGKYYPITVQQLNVSDQQQSGNTIQAKIDKNKLQQGPSLSKDQWQNLYLNSDQWQQEVRAYYSEGSQQRPSAQQGQKSASGADVSVVQPAPKVQVDQPRAQVQVKQPEPKVQVTQPQPQVKVIQPPPRVEVTRPKPEVQVTQPQPKVEISQAEPQVQVEQPKPQVQVEQPKPDVNVEQKQPEVNVSEAQPQVQIQDKGQPQVYVEKQGQADVAIEQKGEPQINIAQKEQQQNQTGLLLIDVDVKKAQAWVGKKLLSQNGEELGTVQDIKASQNGKVAYLMVQGRQQDKIHPIPADMVQTGQNGLQASFDKNAFNDSPSFAQSEQQQMSQQQLDQEVRGYFENKKDGSGNQSQSGQSMQQNNNKQQQQQ